MTDTKWLYGLISALDELAEAASRVLDPDPEYLDSAARWADLMNDLQDAISMANEAGADVPNIREWIERIKGSDMINGKGESHG